ncbi:MAG: outer membrane beta-barrel protein [Cyclobacteriaceae bacterium]
MIRNTLTLLFILIVSNSFAQTAYLKGGTQLATFAGSQRGDNGLLLSYLAGIGLETPIGAIEETELTAELHFSLLGFKSEFDAGSEIRLNYINLPILVRRKFGTTGLYAGAGVGYGLLIRAAAVGGGLKALINDEYKTSDIYIPISMGYYLSEGWSIDLRYHLGITEISVDEDNDSFNRSIQLAVHYFL